MAERLKHQMLEKEQLVDIVAGPDSYRDLPNLLSSVDEGQKAGKNFSGVFKAICFKHHKRLLK